MKRLIKANIYDDFKNEYSKYKTDIGYIYEDANIKEYLDNEMEVTHLESYNFPGTLETPAESGVDIEINVKNDVKQEVIQLVFECLKDNKTENTQEVYDTINELKEKGDYYDDVSLSKLAETLVSIYDPVEWYFDEEYNEEWEDNYLKNYDPEEERISWLEDHQ